ncbi:hypothetical protein FALBO_705 [Fusarium albosuccineum]|uniref:Uncharacterized protein n=1 Tax=Fusarium albosuccineum TaxID=1237068 RepID=A0A8H4LR54_9HYPO|nr:hypothetical protein FALBO_705 [Fusarium albosuccineum]
MEESAPKRRRTSPRTSLNIGGAPSPEPASPRRRRPSYASPTKASLSRHHPDVPDRRRSRSPQKADAQASILPSFDTGVTESPSEVLAARLAGSRLVSDAPTPARPDETTPGSGSSLRRARGGMAAAARRTPSKLPPRPLPAPGAQEDDFNPFHGKVLRRSPPAGARMAIDEPPASMPEPELPRPSQPFSPAEPPASMPEPGLPPTMDSPVAHSEEDSPASPEEPPALPSSEVVDEPSPARSPSPVESPPPVESHSPTESPPAPAPEAEPESERDSPSPLSDLPSSSPEPPPASMPEPELPPLVQPDSQKTAPPASQPAPKLPAPKRDAAQRNSFRNSPIRFRELSQAKDSPVVKPPSRLLEKPRKSFQRAGSATRTIQDRIPAEATVQSRKPRPFDPNSAKKEEREALQKQIDELKKDLKTAQKENERIRLMQKSGRELAPSNQEAIIDLIQRQHVPADTEPGQQASQQLLRAALNPAALLPFGKVMVPAPTVPVEDKQADIKSHHPVIMTAEEELTYLELFTPFSISSNIAVLPQTDGEPLKQLHSITFRSREIPGVFAARVDMIVNAIDLTILDLNVTALEPAAKSELGPFVEKICTGDCNRSMQRNMGILSWAMSEWLRVAVERAGFWCQLDETLGSKDGVSEAASQMRARKPRRRKDDEDEEEDTELTQVESISKVDLIRYMSQQHFDISIPQSGTDESGGVVRLEWKVEFDWTGEAQNKLAVMTGVPGKWHQMDERGSLGKIPKLFGDLVHGGEKPEIAVRTIVALVAGEQS